MILMTVQIDKSAKVAVQRTSHVLYTSRHARRIQPDVDAFNSAHDINKASTSLVIRAMLTNVKAWQKFIDRPTVLLFDEALSVTLVTIKRVMLPAAQYIHSIRKSMYEACSRAQYVVIGNVVDMYTEVHETRECICIIRQCLSVLVQCLDGIVTCMEFEPSSMKNIVRRVYEFDTINKMGPEHRVVATWAMGGIPAMCDITDDPEQMAAEAAALSAVLKCVLHELILDI